MQMPDPQDEIALIEAFSETRVIGLTINHEHMNDTEVTTCIETYVSDLCIPATDALSKSDARLTDMVLSAFPRLRPEPQVAAQ